MRIGILFHKDPLLPPTGIDLIRLRALAGGLISRSIPTEIIAPVSVESCIGGVIPVMPLERLARPGRYDLIKTSYHFSINLINGYEGPVLSRIVRVVDERFPERDEKDRKNLLECQESIRRRADALILNNTENAERWRAMYGTDVPLFQIPNGCPETIPPPGKSPYGLEDRKIVLFLGSLSAARMVEMLNGLAEALDRSAEVHFVGRNKVTMYGGGEHLRLSSRIVDHGERLEEETWRYVQHAHAGLALATGPHPFDNDITKILSYLRGGLPVVSEQGILNNRLISETGFGAVFRYGDSKDLAERTAKLLLSPPVDRRESVMNLIARKHSWSARVDAYVHLIRSVLNRKSARTPRSL